MKRIIIIGGGVSGLTAAINIKNDNNEVIILEKNEIVGKKILVTGNGRCNFLNDDFDVQYYHSIEETDLSSLITDKNKNRIYN